MVAAHLTLICTTSRSTPPQKHWTFPDSGPLSGANGALPWIVFQRDRQEFRIEVPQPRDSSSAALLAISLPCLRWSFPCVKLMPEATFALWRKLESWLCTWPRHWSMFALIHLTGARMSLRSSAESSGDPLNRSFKIFRPARALPRNRGARCSLRSLRIRFMTKRSISSRTSRCFSYFIERGRAPSIPGP